MFATDKWNKQTKLPKNKSQAYLLTSIQGVPNIVNKLNLNFFYKKEN